MSEQSVSKTCIWINHTWIFWKKWCLFTRKTYQVWQKVYKFFQLIQLWFPSFRVGFMLGYPITISVAHRYNPGSWTARPSKNKHFLFGIRSLFSIAMLNFDFSRAMWKRFGRKYKNTIANNWDELATNLNWWSPEKSALSTGTDAGLLWLMS